nr:BTAD domain-containing putative transcriptional regulator [Streptomyces sp. SID1328]
MRAARAAVGEGRTAEAVTDLRQALALWRGPAPSGRGGRVVEAAVTVWEERRLAAAEQYFELCLAQGEAAELVGDLRDLVGRHPLRETLRGHLMLALHRSGRGAEALEEYAAVRRLLGEELGIDPGAQLTRLHEGILREDLEPAPRPPAPRPAPVPGPVPADRGVCTLPYDLTDFTGRDHKLRLLLDKADESDGEGTRIIAVDGMGGSGKTTLAVRAAHRLADRYPDGQLFVDLRGFTPGERPLRPEVALEGLLRALGVPDERLPEGTEERTALWRGMVARKRVLILLDNAADPGQVVPLLPASSGCLVLITSRGRLVDLDGVDWIGLGMLAPEESVTLLAETLGAERAAAEPGAVAELAELCGRLPLALRIAAARLRNRPRWTVAHLVERLSHETRRLDELSTGRRSVTATLELSYQALSAAGRAGFRLLGQHPGTEIDVWSAAALTGTSAREAEDLLEYLLDAHMVQQHALGLYSFHDLVRSFARSLPGEGTGGGVLAERLLPYYLRATEAACEVLFPDRMRLEWGAEVRPAALPPLRTVAEAMEWFDREYRMVQAALDREGDLADPACVVRLSRNLAFYLYTRSKPDEQVAQGRTAVRAARRLGDRNLLCLSLNNLGVAQWRAGRFRDGIDSVSEAREIARALGDEVGPAGRGVRLLLHRRQRVLVDAGPDGAERGTRAGHQRRLAGLTGIGPAVGGDRGCGQRADVHGDRFRARRDAAGADDAGGAALGGPQGATAAGGGRGAGRGAGGRGARATTRVLMPGARARLLRCVSRFVPVPGDSGGNRGQQYPGRRKRSTRPRLGAGRDKGWGMLSNAIKLAGVLVMTFVLALGGSAALSGSGKAEHSMAQGEGPASPRA